jgi:purine-binding chemotaxis protein CheW
MTSDRSGSGKLEQSIKGLFSKVRTAPAEPAPAEAQGAVGATELAGTYAIVEIGPERYGVPVERIDQVIRMVQITRLPKPPRHVLGVINLRGRVIPVADGAELLGLSRGAYTAHSHIAVLKTGGDRLVAVLVGVVDDVAHVPAEAIEIRERFAEDAVVRAAAKLPGGLVLLMDTDALLRGVKTPA